MSDTPKTTMPTTRGDLRSALVWLTIAAAVYEIGHIPGVINSATLITAGSIGWAALKLVAVMRRIHSRMTAAIGMRLSDKTSQQRSAPPSFPPRVVRPSLTTASRTSTEHRYGRSLVSQPHGKR